MSGYKIIVQIKERLGNLGRTHMEGKLIHTIDKQDKSTFTLY